MGWKLKTSERNYFLLRNFGITLEEFNKILEAQNNLCAICKQPETRQFNGRTSSLALDHCHETGKVRGLLCWRCNSGIGKLRDNSELLRNAADYLDRYK